jgi:Uncharacterised nucleotidyltransferase
MNLVDPNQLARILVGAEDLSRIPPRGWEQLLAQARVAGLWARLGERLADRAAGEVPQRLLAHLDSGRQVGASVRAAMSAEVLRVSAALASSGIRCVLLKGTAYLMADLPPARGRIFGDIDLLVPRETLDQAEHALMGGGWLCQGVDAYDMRYYRTWMHEIPPLTHVQRHSVLDLHHTITPPTSSFAVDGGLLLAQAQCINAAHNLWILQPVDLVLHSAVHLFSEGEFDHGLRDMLDLHDLIRHFDAQQSDFWPRLFDRAQELALQRPLHHALQALAFLFGLKVPATHADRLQALRPPLLQRVLMAWLLSRVLKPPHGSCSQPGDGLVRWLLYVRSHWLRMPVRLLVPHLLRKAWKTRFTAATPAVVPAAEPGAPTR